MSLLHPNVCFQLLKLGLVLPNETKVYEYIFFGKFARLGYNSSYRNMSVGSFSYFSDKNQVENSRFGNYCSIADSVNCGVQTQDLSQTATSNLFVDSTSFDFDNLTPKSMHLPPAKMPTHKAIVRVGHDVWMGSKVKICGDVTIGTGTVIGAGSVITKDVPPYSIVVGNNRIVRQRFSDEVISDLLESEWWEYNLPQIKQDGHKIRYDSPEHMLEDLRNLDPEQKPKLSDQIVMLHLGTKDEQQSAISPMCCSRQDVDRFFQLLDQTYHPTYGCQL